MYIRIRKQSVFMEPCPNHLVKRFSRQMQKYCTKVLILDILESMLDWKITVVQMRNRPNFHDIGTIITVAS
jgi:hypothetical protein